MGLDIRYQREQYIYFIVAIEAQFLKK